MTTNLEADERAAISHFKSKAYFANAAAGLVARPVLDATISYLRLEAELGAVSAAAQSEGIFARSYDAAARLIGAKTDEIAIVESGNRGLAALIQTLRLTPGDHVLVDRTCWGGTLDMLSSYADIVVDIMPVDTNGRVDPVAARASAHPKTKAIILTWCPATSGIVNPALEIGALAADLGSYYLIDACQAVGQIQVDVAALRCHGLVASGRKWLRGPRGTALLFASRDFLRATETFMPTQFGRSRTDARRYEQGEAYLAGRIGLGVAIEMVLTATQENVTARLMAIAKDTREALLSLSGVSLVETGPGLSALIAFTVSDRPSANVTASLARDGIAASLVDDFYTPLDMAARKLNSVVRVAPHLFTTSQHIDALIAALRSPS